MRLLLVTHLKAHTFLNIFLMNNTSLVTTTKNVTSISWMQWLNRLNQSTTQCMKQPNEVQQPLTFIIHLSFNLLNWSCCIFVIFFVGPWCVFSVNICVFKQEIWAGWGNVWRTEWESMDWIRRETLPSTGDAMEDTKVRIRKVPCIGVGAVCLFLLS